MLNVMLGKEFMEFNIQLGDVRAGMEELKVESKGSFSPAEYRIWVLLRIVERKKREVLGCLSGVDFSAHHKKASDLRFDGTGTWLFGEREFQSWIEAQTSSVMALHGKGNAFDPMNGDLVS